MLGVSVASWSAGLGENAQDVIAFDFVEPGVGAGFRLVGSRRVG